MRSGRVLAVALLMCACRPRSQPSDKDAPPSAIEARIERTDGGKALLFAGKFGSTPLPTEEAEGVVVSDATRVAVRSRRGGFRVFHVVGDRLLPGPDLRPDWKAATLEAEARALYAANPDARAAIFAEARKRGGDDAVARILARTVDTDDAIWKAAEEALPAEKRQLVKTEIKRSLERGAPADALMGAIATVDLRDASVLAQLGPRVLELAKERPVPHPRALGAMLRVLARERAEEAGRVSCDVLALGDPGGAAPLLDGALLAAAHAKAKCADAVVKVLKEDRCHASFRCGPGGARIGPRTASDQTEALCTNLELAPEVEAELARTVADVVKDDTAWTERWGLAALAATDAIPAAWITAHERRRYTITQPKTPACGEGQLGTPCRCDEATLRDHACRTDASPVTVAFCRFEVDPKKKTIGNVTYQGM